jgi:hypothetical protein
MKTFQQFCENASGISQSRETASLKTAENLQKPAVIAQKANIAQKEAAVERQRAELESRLNAQEEQIARLKKQVQQ